MIFAATMLQPCAQAEGKQLIAIIRQDLKRRLRTRWDFNGKVNQVTANPIIWSDDRSLAVVWEDTGANCMRYTFWCLKRTAQGNMAPLAKYMIRTYFPKRAVMLKEHN